MAEEAEPRSTGIVAVEGVPIETGTIMRPLGDRVIVIEDPRPQQTDSGIFLPQTSGKGETRRGIVIVTGPGPRSPLTGEPVAMNLNEGDAVIFAPMSGIEIVVDGIQLLVLRESDIISVYETPAAG